jgi:hypothetical protein
MVRRLKPTPAQVKTTAKTNVVKPKIAAKVAAIENRSFQAFMLIHYLILQSLFTGAYNFYALTPTIHP